MIIWHQSCWTLSRGCSTFPEELATMRRCCATETVQLQATRERARALKAGQTLSSFGWLGLIFLPVFLVIKWAPRYLFGAEEIAGLVSLCLFFLSFPLVGGQVKRNKRWAKATAAALSVLILPQLPVGTLVGIVTLFHLILGERAR